MILLILNHLQKTTSVFILLTIEHGTHTKSKRFVVSPGLK